jgi:hypothetical protein
VSALAKAREAHGFAPDWIEALAVACDASTGRAVARRLGVSPAAVCRVLANAYGDTERMERRVREILMATAVICPVLGDIDAATCREHQKRPYTPINPTFVRLFRACRTCPQQETPHDQGRQVCGA